MGVFGVMVTVVGCVFGVIVSAVGIVCALHFRQRRARGFPRELRLGPPSAWAGGGGESDEEFWRDE